MRVSLCFLFGLLTLTLTAATLQPAGVVGNSGSLEQPVRFAEPAARALGGAYDPARGWFFERAGARQLHAYTLDGRVAATYPLPAGSNQDDAMVRCGDRLVLLLGGRLYQLPLAAPSGTAPTSLCPEWKQLTNLSGSSFRGRIAVRAENGEIRLLNPQNGQTEVFGQAPAPHVHGMDFDQQGNFYLVIGREAHKLVDGKLLANGDWPRRFIGNREPGIDRARRLGDYWYGFAGHGTVKRFDADFAPAPGVVYGGASGHFIGSVPVDGDLENGRGIHQLTPGVFALSGLDGVVLLAEWRPELQRFRVLRRIGALPEPATLALDRRGRLLFGHNIWAADADSRSPAAVGLPFSGTAPAAYRDGDAILIPLHLYGRPGLAGGELEYGKIGRAQYPRMKLPEKVIGTALLTLDRKPTLLLLTPDGRLLAHEVSGGATYAWRRELPAPRLNPKTPIRRYTSLVALPDQQLLAAGDGQLLHFVRDDGGNWRETERWSDDFGPELTLAAADSLLAVADAEKGTVTVYDWPTRRKLASAPCGRPEAVAFNNDRIAVYDRAGQCLRRFLFTP